MQSWHLDLVIEDASSEQAGYILKEAVSLIESKGLSAGGGIHPFGDVTVNEECQGCFREVCLPKGEYKISEIWHMPLGLTLVGGS